MSTRYGRGRRAASLILFALVSYTCATNPATGQKQISIISEQQEIAMGKEAAQEIPSRLGLYDDADLDAYVSGLGHRLAATSERPKLDWHFGVVDDPGVNAFALPGGYVYVTRGLLAHVGSEAELAGVMGHEIGHVTARHSVQQATKAQLMSLGLGLGMILRPQLMNLSDLAQAGMQLLFLKYSRNDESQADSLGLRYMTRGGYEPQAMVEVFHTLDRVGAAEAKGSRVPTWLSTHPAPANRATAIEQQMAGLPAAVHTGKLDTQDYLGHLDGMVYGDDPRQGFFDGTRFFHPEMRFELDLPRGWHVVNQREAVGAISPDQDAIVVLRLAQRRSAREAASEFFGQQNVRQGRAWSGDVSGQNAISAEFLAGTEQGVLQGVATFVEMGGKVFQILGYTPQSRFGYYARTIEEAAGSFKPLDDPRRLDVEPRRLELVTIDQPTSLRAFAERHPSSVPLQTIAVLNGVSDLDASLAAGRRLKRVVGGKGLPALPEPGASPRPRR